MVRVLYSRKRCMMTIKGHASSGEAGHDLVCAAISTLAYTLIQNVTEMQDAGLLKDVHVTEEAGNVTVVALPKAFRMKETRQTFDVIARGFALLSQNYPENLTIRYV